MIIVIGLTGSFGSGCSYISKNFLEPKGYNKISLSDILKKEYEKEKKEKPPKKREKLQEYGNYIRKEKGLDYLVQKAVEIIKTDKSHNKWVIDSIKNPNEIKTLKKTFNEFYLFGIFAEQNTRWERVKEGSYDGDKGQFDRDDERDKDDDLKHGQNVQGCFYKADIIINNDEHIQTIRNQTFDDLQKVVEKYLNLIEDKSSEFVPNENETLMAMAYANSLRSRCCKRKVGAIIMDLEGNVFSSGFNDVPSDLDSCQKIYTMCYRYYIKNKFKDTIYELEDEEEEAERIWKKFNKTFKNLDLCRAMHAEESAILNVAKFGSSTALIGSKLYTTTYPCNLCANKIATVGIKYIVYSEPYPVEEAKVILNGYDVKEEPFEGVTFNGYFRFMR